MLFTRFAHLITTVMRLALVLAIGLAVGGRAPTAVYAAASLNVTTTADELNSDGDCSLREAIRAANLDAQVDACAGRHGTDTINLPAGIYTLTLAGANEDAVATGDLDITANLTIKGKGATKTFIDGNAVDRVFDIIAGKVTLSDVTIRNGATLFNGLTQLDRGGGGILNRGGTLKLEKSTVTGNLAGYGSGIYNAGTLTIKNSSIASNRSAHWSGGGIYNSGSLTLDKSSVSDNSAAESTGGIYNDGGTLQVTESTINNNAASEGVGGINGWTSGSISILDSTIRDNINGNDQGGGLFCSQGVTVTIANSTISGNRAQGEDSSGGGIWCSGNLTITNSTISGNQTWGSGGGIQSAGSTTLNNVTIAGNAANIDGDAVGDGGGVRIDGGTFSVANSIIAANQDGGGEAPDCSGALTSRGHNIIQQTAGCTIGGSSSGNQTGVDPRLALLGDNGGETFTHALRSNSPALDKGSSATPGSSDQACMPKDQRGVRRPQGQRCDIGAYERRP